MSLLDKLPPIRRVVTGHDEAGRAIVRSDEAIAPNRLRDGAARVLQAWSAPTLPVDLNDAADGRDRPLPLGRGSMIRIVDMTPGFSTAMHRTASLDYGILLAGEMELELDDGAVVRLAPGDIVVQRGTIHLWRNPSAIEPCRIVFVMTQADAPTVAGERLAEIDG